MDGRFDEITDLIERLAPQPYYAATKHGLGNAKPPIDVVLSSTEATTILLGDDILAVQIFCDDNTALCLNDDLWKALFENRFEGLFPLFQEVIDGFRSKGIEGIDPFVTAGSKGSYNPLIWRDSYTDLFNMPQELLSIVEKIVNNETLDDSDSALFPNLYGQFWTVGVILANIGTKSGPLVISMLLTAMNLLPYVLFIRDTVKSDVMTDALDSLDLSEDAMLFILDKRMMFLGGAMLSSAVRLGYPRIVEMRLPKVIFPSTDFFKYVSTASANVYPDVLKLLLENKRFEPYGPKINLIKLS